MRSPDPNPQPPTTRLGPLPGPGRLALLSLCLALLTFAVYLPTGNNEFVNYDDPDYITSNPQVQRGLTLDGTRWAFRAGHASNWHPVTWLSHMVDVELFGLRAGPMHLMNGAFHTANAVLLLLLFVGLTSASWRSWFVAAFFALHPLHVESVAWAAERKDVLSTLFLLLTLLAYTRYVRAATARRRWTFYGLALTSFSLGLMSKAMLVTLPFMLLLLDYWPLKRLPPTVGDRRWPSLSGLLLEKGPFFLLSAGASVVTFVVQREGGAVDSHFSPAVRIGNAVVAYAAYLFKAVWPVDLAVLYPHPGSRPLLLVLGCALLLGAISVAAFVCRRSKPYLLVGWLWFAGTLVPVIGLVQVGLQSMADRYTYVPLTGVFLAVVWLSADLAGSQPVRLRLLASGGGAALLACGLLTIRQLGFWRNSETLFQHALEVTRGNFVACNALGFHYGTHDRAELEIEYYRKSLEINPRYVEALNNMGCALSNRRRFAEALPFLDQAVRESPRNVEVQYNFANVLWELGRRDEAVRHYRLTVELKPDHAEAHDKLGMAAVLAKDLPKAVGHFEQSIKARPDFAPAYSHLGNVHALQQRWEEAIRRHRESLRLQSGNSAYHYNLGSVLLQVNRPSEAAPALREAVRLAPGDPDAVYKLGLALLAAGDREGAAGCLEQALRLRPGFADAQRQLQALRR